MDSDYVEPTEFFTRMLKNFLYLEKNKTMKRVTQVLNYVLLLLTVYLIIKYGTKWFNGETRVNLSYNLTIYMTAILIRFFLLLYKIRKNSIENQKEHYFDFYNEGVPVYTGVLPADPNIDIKIIATPDKVDRKSVV